MAITVVASSGWVFGNSPQTVTIPGSATAGDLMLLLASNPWGATLTVSGWTKVGQGSFVANCGNGAAFWKVHDGSEPNPSVVDSSGQYVHGNVYVLQGADPTAIAGTGFTGSSPSWPISGAANLGVTANDILFGIIGGSDDGFDDGQVFTTTGISAPGVTWAASVVATPGKSEQASGSALAGYRVAASGTSSGVPTMDTDTGGGRIGGYWVMVPQLLPEAALGRMGEAAGFRGLTVAPSGPSMVYLTRRPIERTGFRGLTVRAIGPRQVALVGRHLDTSEMTEGGTDGQVLTYNASAPPSWENAAAPTLDWGEDADITDLDYDDVADAGALDEVARADHRHGMPSEPTGGGGLGPLLLASDHATPITFDDILQASDGADLLYASEP